MDPRRVAWLAVLLLVAGPASALAASCTTQAQLQPQDRSALAAIGQRLTTAVLQQDYATLQANLLPAVSGQWDGMHNEVDLGAQVVKGGQPQLQSIYLMDASSQTAASDTQFFCSNATGTLTVTINMHALPPGRYALILANAAGSALGGQIGLIVVWDSTGAAPAWKLGGVSVRQGSIGGHDGVWYWSQARSSAIAGNTWGAWYTYDLAHYLLLPVDFLSSPNMEKLEHEQAQLQPQPGPFPLHLQDGDRTWTIQGIRIDTTLRTADLAVTYESLGIADPAAARTEAMAVLGALLRAHPELRNGFHGLWALASKDGKVTPVIELTMDQIH